MRKQKLSPAEKFLAAHFWRSGRVRLQDPQRYQEEGHKKYKKGDEIRLVVNDVDELEELLAAMEVAGFTPGRPYLGVKQMILPLYGKAEVARFLQMVAASKLPSELTTPTGRLRHCTWGGNTPSKS